MLSAVPPSGPPLDKSPYTAHAVMFCVLRDCLVKVPPARGPRATWSYMIRTSCAYPHPALWTLETLLKDKVPASRAGVLCRIYSRKEAIGKASVLCAGVLTLVPLGVNQPQVQPDFAKVSRLKEQGSPLGTDLENSLDTSQRRSFSPSGLTSACLLILEQLDFAVPARPAA
ncbi:hypothetical protein CSUB01_01789 [Colletotrichum sublineola]|uniref:Uncharacterized protein n=1 Tax=Colletotrichum sublineola TaxID=1173701 RepID=A0A066XGF6_COLSU|nr:hypothetical protein CSUB01_01789 [Colletotrichum sublineola]